MENENKKSNKLLYVVCVLLAVIIIAYYTFWLTICNKYKQQIEKNIKEIPDITYKSISPTGFPFKFGLKFNNLKFVKNQNNKQVALKINSIIVSKSIKSDYAKLSLDKIIAETGNQASEILIDKTSEIKLKFSVNEITSINVIAPKIVIKSLSFKNRENLVTNLIYKTETIKGESYENKPNFFDIEKISMFSVENGKKVLLKEFNTSLSFSIVNILNGENIVSSGFEIEKITFNNITDNYSIDMVGNSKMNENKNASASLDIYLKNYENLLNSIKDPVQSGTIRLIYTSIPELDKQGQDKHITIKKEINSNVITINGKDLNEILTSMAGATQLLNPDNLKVK